MAVGAIGTALWFNKEKTTTTTTASSTVDRNRSVGYKSGFIDTIGNTPLIKLEKLSKATGCTILGKAEFLNPGGSIKDRPAKFMIENAIKNNLINDKRILEATGGNTGIALALLCNSLGYKLDLTLRDSLSKEKIDRLKLLGANVIECESVGYENNENNKHFYNIATKLSKSKKDEYYFIDQFQNLSNCDSHYYTTGPEIYKQCNGNIDYITCAAGTGGTLSGLAKYFKEIDENINIIHVGLVGEGLQYWINNVKDMIYDSKNNKKIHDILPKPKNNKDGKNDKDKNKYDGHTIAEGAGVGRMTNNILNCTDKGYIDKSIFVSNEEIITMCYYLLYNEGIYIGPSGAANVVSATKIAKLIENGNGDMIGGNGIKKYNNNESPVIVTILCDGGANYQSRIYNNEWIKENNYTKFVDQAKTNSFDNLDWIKLDNL